MELKVKGMHCPSCKMLIEEALEDIDCKNISISVNTETQTGKISCETTKSKEEIVKAIESEGDYRVE